MAVDLASTSARAAVLQRIRTAIAEPPASPEVIATEWQQIPRDYVRTAHADREQIIELLEDRLRDYDATVVRTTPGNVSAQIADTLRSRAKHRLVVPIGLADALGEPLPEGFEFIPDTSLSPVELDAMEGVVTASTVAVASTGTIMLQVVPGQGRRAPTLVPDYHLCLLRMADIVETIPEAIARLQPTAAVATTMISGPSATADIEMTRIKGVHGPRFLDVILIG